MITKEQRKQSMPKTLHTMFSEADIPKTQGYDWFSGIGELSKEQLRSLLAPASKAIENVQSILDRAIAELEEKEGKDD